MLLPAPLSPHPPALWLPGCTQVFLGWGRGSDLTTVRRPTSPRARRALAPCCCQVDVEPWDPATTVSSRGSPGHLSRLSHLRHGAQPCSACLINVLNPQPSDSPSATLTSCVQCLRAPLDRDLSWAGGRASPRTDSHTQIGTRRPRGSGAELCLFPGRSQFMSTLSQKNGPPPSQQCSFYR